MTLLNEIDLLYERTVMSPDSVTEQSFVDWMENVATGHQVDRVAAKYVRRCLQVARKLAAFWQGAPSASSAPPDWRARVDVAQGSRAWRPQLELAQHLLEKTPSEETFGYVVDLFRVVVNEPFLDGISYEEWLDARRN